MTTSPGAPTDEASAALADAVAAIGRFAARATWQSSDEALREQFALLDQLTRLGQGQALRVLADVAGRGLPGQGGHARLSCWVREVLPTTSPREAGTAARRAEALFTTATATHLAPTRAAVLAGDLTGDQVDVVVAAVQALTPPTVPAGTVDDQTLAEAQGFLLTEARTFDATKLRRLATHLRLRLDPDADDRLARDEDARDHARALTLSTQASGLVLLTGTLTPQCGAALTTALDAWSAPRPATDGTPDPRTGAQRRHDALHHLADRAIATPGVLPTTHGSPYRVVVSVPHQTLAATLAPDPDPDTDAAANADWAPDRGPRQAGLAPALLPDGTAISTLALQVIACGADLVPVLTDTLGCPLDVADTQYAFPTKQRTAIAARDQGCTFPNCGAPPAWADVHHIKPFSRGGSTSTANGTLLCGRHHRHVHRIGARADLVDGEIHWNTGPPHTPPASPAMTRATRAIDALTHRWENPPAPLNPGGHGS